MGQIKNIKLHIVTDIKVTDYKMYVPRGIFKVLTHRVSFHQQVISWRQLHTTVYIDHQSNIDSMSHGLNSHHNANRKFGERLHSSRNLAMRERKVKQLLRMSLQNDSNDNNNNNNNNNN